MSRQEKIEIEYVGSLHGHNGWVTALTVGKDSNGKPLLVSGSRDKKLIVWNLHLDNPEVILNSEGRETEEKKIGKPFKSLGGHSHFVSSLSLSKDSKYVLSSSWDKTIRLWDLNTFKTRTLITDHSKDVLTTTFANEDRSIISGSMDKTLRIFNIKGELKHSNTDFNGWVSSITQIRQDKANYIAVGSQDKTVKIYDNDYALQYTIEDFDYPVVSTATDNDGEFIFSAEKNGKIKVHNFDGITNPLKSTIEVNADINSISFRSEYFLAIIIASSKGLIVQEVAKQAKVLYQKSFGACLSLAWDEDKKYLFAGFSDGGIRVFKFSLNQ